MGRVHRNSKKATCTGWPSQENRDGKRVQQVRVIKDKDRNVFTHRCQKCDRKIDRVL